MSARLVTASLVIGVPDSSDAVTAVLVETAEAGAALIQSGGRAAVASEQLAVEVLVILGRDPDEAERFVADRMNRPSGLGS